MNKKHEAIVGEQAIGSQDENVDKIREILFGGQMRDYQRRFDDLEKRISAAAETLRRDVTSRMDGLESFVKKELEVLGERLSAERQARGAERDRADAELHEARRLLEDALARLGEETAAEARGLRAALQDRSAELDDLVRRTRDELDDSLRQQADALEDRKVAREDLAAMFSEVALRLNRELDLPAGD